MKISLNTELHLPSQGIEIAYFSQAIEAQFQRISQASYVIPGQNTFIHCNGDQGNAKVVRNTGKTKPKEEKVMYPNWMQYAYCNRKYL